MPTFIKPTVDKRVLIQVAVSVARDGSELDYRFAGLVDTGAQRTAITKRAAYEIGAVPIGHDSFVVASGHQIETNLYAIHLAIPVESPAPEGTPIDTYALGTTLIVFELPHQPDYDVIIGMDVLSMTHISMHGDLLVISV